MSIIDATTRGFLKVAVYSALTDESLLPALVKGPGEKRNEFFSRIIKQQLEFIPTKFSVEIKYQLIITRRSFPIYKVLVKIMSVTKMKF